MDEVNNGSESSSSASSCTNSSSIGGQLTRSDIGEKPELTEIKIILSPSKSFTYHYSARPRSRVLLIVFSALSCLIFIASPSLISSAISIDSPVTRVLSFIPILLGIPYIFFVMYRLFIQGSHESKDASEPKKVHLSLNLAGEGKELAGWAGGLAGVATFISIIIEILH